ncbi:unnamed protein product [Rangifer tarandus platyrhynchus]|uniref:Uncharacterized protein n=2 Tax=Rangifer tarandus platyrhynchus TaxID=3082113 RepID=A0ABN8Y0J6_RANTA|nr:unnamed protein product [Rangifer tarandus platyrhynchus]CAI9713291.1 unnamed protein product [Rangifer tarandus platyrhynchus]
MAWPWWTAPAPPTWPRLFRPVARPTSSCLATALPDSPSARPCRLLPSPGLLPSPALFPGPALRPSRALLPWSASAPSLSRSRSCAPAHLEPAHRVLSEGVPSPGRRNLCTDLCLLV